MAGAEGREPGLRAAIAAAGGLRALARALRAKPQSLQKWTRVPQGRLFQIAQICALAPAALRPDLAGWIAEETGRRRLALARERFTLIRGACGVRAVVTRQGEDELAIDILTAMAAARFVAAEKSVALAALLVGKGIEAQAGRSLAMALAHVAGRARSEAIGIFFGCSRQNVDNASERYRRARDGDDEEDVQAGRVVERGRLRRAKAASAELWALERAFADRLAHPEPTRKTA